MTKLDMIYRVQASLLQGLMGFLGALPPRLSSQTGGALLLALSPLLKAQNKRVSRHIALAFPNKTDSERRSIQKGMWRHLGMIIGEYPHLGAALDRHPDFTIDVTGAEHLTATIGRATVFMSAHVGNWEILPIAGFLHGMPSHAVYRAPNNPYAAKLLERYRSANDRLPVGFPKSRAGMKQISDALRTQKCVGMLIDQRHSGGTAINFFGHPAQTTLIAADLALKYDAVILTARVKRRGPCDFLVEVFPPLENKGKSALEITQEVYGCFENWITDAPEQWLWTHRRWGKNV